MHLRLFHKNIQYMYYIIMYYISKLFEMRFCYTVVFTSNYAQIPRPIISVNSSFLRGQFAKVVKLENFFEFLQNSWAVIRTCARQTEQPSNLITMGHYFLDIQWSWNLNMVISSYNNVVHNKCIQCLVDILLTQNLYNLLIY